MRIRDEALYLCDNGAAYCGEHLGQTARITGRDISGQSIRKVTPEDAAEMEKVIGHPLGCERVARVVVALHGAGPDSCL